MARYSKEVTDALNARKEADAFLKKQGFTMKDGKPRKLIRLTKDERGRIEGCLMEERRCIITHNGRRATVFSFGGYHGRKPPPSRCAINNPKNAALAGGAS